MADLFDQLKSAGPVKQQKISPAKSVSPPKKVAVSLQELLNKHKSKSSDKRRDSLPTTISTVLKKSKPQKARSLSPPKYGTPSGIKSLKVKLERKKLEEFLTRPLEEHANNIRKKQEKPKDANKLLKVTPTKAQQKQFEPLVGQKKSKAPVLKQFNVKPCKVRIHRDNLQKLAKEFQNKSALKKEGKPKSMKRPAVMSSGDSPPSKKGKTANDNKITKSKNNFFIKLNTSPSSKLEKKIKNLSSKPNSLSSEAFHNKMKNSKFNNTTMPTKFSRSELFRSFGKRFFNVHVKMERCTHPLMLTFESNERARRLQAKRNNKSKNLSVSFSEQVEIFGDSSDPDDSCDEDFCAVPTNRNKSKSNVSHSFSVPATPVVMPARLKKIENGRVVDDIKLDPTLFMDPKVLVASTPFSPGRKKRDHSKSFSPLKDETSPSPRKEQLKLANERIQPSSLRRLNIEDEEDEDDDCEYIVPIELPQRRTSRTSSNATLEDLTSADLPLTFPEIFNNDAGTDNTNFTTSANKEMNKFGVGAKDNISAENGSDDSFQSAKDSQDKNSEVNDGGDNQFSSLRAGLDFGTNKALGKVQQTNGNACNDTANKHLEDISLNLFMEDSQTNDDNHSKSFVVSLINETIDKLSKDIEENATDKHYSNAT